MGETGENDSTPGLYKKTEAPIDISKATVEDMQNLNKVSERSGIDFPLDGDKNTVTPERFVVVPRKPKGGRRVV